MDKEEKQEVIQNFGQSENDCGSSDVQVALFTKRISELTEHCRRHPKDVHSRRGLQMLVNKRRKHLNYLKQKNYRRYRDVIQELGLRS
mgnify:CR=1 FL=1